MPLVLKRRSRIRKRRSPLEKAIILNRRIVANAMAHGRKPSGVSRIRSQRRPASPELEPLWEKDERRAQQKYFYRFKNITERFATVRGAFLHLYPLLWFILSVFCDSLWFTPGKIHRVQPPVPTLSLCLWIDNRKYRHRKVPPSGVPREFHWPYYYLPNEAWVFGLMDCSRPHSRWAKILFAHSFQSETTATLADNETEMDIELSIRRLSRRLKSKYGFKLDIWVVCDLHCLRLLTLSGAGCPSCDFAKTSENGLPLFDFVKCERVHWDIDHCAADLLGHILLQVKRSLPEAAAAAYDRGLKELSGRPLPQGAIEGIMFCHVKLIIGWNPESPEHKKPRLLGRIVSLLKDPFVSFTWVHGFQQLAGLFCRLTYILASKEQTPQELQFFDQNCSHLGPLWDSVYPGVERLHSIHWYEVHHRTLIKEILPHATRTEGNEALNDHHLHSFEKRSPGFRELPGIGVSGEETVLWEANQHWPILKDAALPGMGLAALRLHP